MDNGLESFRPASHNRSPKKREKEALSPTLSSPVTNDILARCRLIRGQDFYIFHLSHVLWRTDVHQAHPPLMQSARAGERECAAQCVPLTLMACHIGSNDRIFVHKPNRAYVLVLVGRCRRGGWSSSSSSFWGTTLLCPTAQLCPVTRIFAMRPKRHHPTQPSYYISIRKNSGFRWIWGQDGC